VHKPKNELEARAAEWMASNPDAMLHLERMALQLWRDGKKFGVKRLVEQIRWDLCGIQNAAMFKINNSHTAYIARELLLRRPVLRDFIELRVVKCEKVAA
jgi:hypothetical protein